MGDNDFYSDVQTASGISSVINPWKIFLDQSKNYPLLSREEEQELAKEIEDCFHVFLSSLCIYAEEGTTSMGYLYWELKSLFEDRRICKEDYEQFFNLGKSIETSEFYTPEQCMEHENYETLFQLLCYKLPRNGLRNAAYNLNKYLEESEVESPARAFLHRSVKREKKLVNKFLCSNIRLVAKISMEYHNRHKEEMRSMDLLDIVQYGNIGLMKAIDKFDYRRGFKFSSYASRPILSAIIDGFVADARTLRLSRTWLSHYRKFTKARIKLEVTLGREATLDEVASNLGMKRKQLEKILQYTTQGGPLEHDLGEGPKKYGPLVTSSKKCPERITGRFQTRKILENLIKEHLTEQETEIIRLKYGLWDGNDKTYEEIGEKFNLTRQRINQIAKVALEKLKGESETKGFM